MVVDLREFLSATGELHDSEVLSLTISFGEKRATLELLQVSLDYDLNQPPPTSHLVIRFGGLDGIFGDIAAIGEVGTRIIWADCTPVGPGLSRCVLHMAGRVVGASAYPRLEFVFASASVDGEPIFLSAPSAD